MKLPVYEMIINDDTASDVEVSFIALVDRPAIERNFLKFKDQKINFVADPERKIISGPVMIADSLIYRKDPDGVEYNVFFSKETIEKIVLKFFKKDFQKNINLFHDAPQEGATIFESFISDAQRGVNPMKGFEDVPDGSWFISVKVENIEVWEKIKSGEVRGFSVEGIFNFSRSLSGKDFNNLHLLEMDVMTEVKNLLRQIVEKFIGVTPDPLTPPAPANLAAPIEYELKDGKSAMIDKLEVGGVVLIDMLAAAPGEYELKDETKFTVGEAGVITAVELKILAPVPDPSLEANKKFAEIEEKIAVQNVLIEKMILQNTKSATALTDIFSLIEKIADLPTGDPDVLPGEFNIANTSKDEKRKNLTKLLGDLRNKK